MDIRKNYVKPVTPEGTKKILEQMTKSICKVKNNEIIGTGFFCQIPFINNSKMNVLITSYQIIDDYYLNQNNKINIFINNNELKVINLTPDRKIFSTKNFNATIIELKDSDNINNFLELDENIFRNDTIDYYQFQSIYILQYLFSGSTCVSYGILNKLNELNIEHTCFSESGSNGAPILNLSNNKVIGISMDSIKNNNFNSGIILKYAVEEFKNKYTNINQQFMNNNFQMQNMMMNNNANFNPNFQMPNMMLMNNNNFIPNNNFIQNFNMNNNIFPGNNMMFNDNNIPKMNIEFKTTNGIIYNIEVKYGTTIAELLAIYLKKIERPELIGKSDKIAFLFNGYRLRIEDITPVEEFFKLAPYPTIMVDDGISLIGG